MNVRPAEQSVGQGSPLRCLARFRVSELLRELSINRESRVVITFGGFRLGTLQELDRFQNDPVFAIVVHDLENAYKEIERISYGGKGANLKERSEILTILEAYSLFLEKNGYMDIDWRSEEPFAIDEFMKTFTDGNS